MLRMFILMIFLFYNCPNIAIAEIAKEKEKTFALKVFLLEDSEWEESEIKNLLEITSRTLSQCDIFITYQEIESLKGVLPQGNLYLYDRKDPDSDRPGGDLDLVRSLALKERKEILIFFIGEFDFPTYGVARFSKLNSGSLLENTVFITQRERELDDRNTLAHELGHILTNEGHFYMGEPNLMHYDQYRMDDDLTSQQCKKMHKFNLQD